MLSRHLKRAESIVLILNIHPLILHLLILIGVLNISRGLLPNLIHLSHQLLHSLLHLLILNIIIPLPKLLNILLTLLILLCLERTISQQINYLTLVALLFVDCLEQLLACEELVQLDVVFWGLEQELAVVLFPLLEHEGEDEVQAGFGQLEVLFKQLVVGSLK